MPLFLVVHTVGSVSAKVPFALISLLDAVRSKATPADLRCRQVTPTSGKVSTSLWDAPDAAALQAWLSSNIDADCTHEVCVVQEDFALGLAAEVGRARAADAAAGVAGAARTKVAALADDLRRREGTGTAIAAAAKAGAVLKGATTAAAAAAMENDTVAAAAGAAGRGWRALRASAGRLAADVRGNRAGAAAYGVYEPASLPAAAAAPPPPSYEQAVGAAAANPTPAAPAPAPGP